MRRVELLLCVDAMHLMLQITLPTFRQQMLSTRAAPLLPGVPCLLASVLVLPLQHVVLIHVPAASGILPLFESVVRRLFGPPQLRPVAWLRQSLLQPGCTL